MFAEIGHYVGGNMRVIHALLTSLEHVTEIAAFLKMKEREELLVALQTSLAAIDTTAYPTWSKSTSV